MCDKTRTKEVGVLQADPDVRPNVKTGHLVMLENRWELRK